MAPAGSPAVPAQGGAKGPLDARQGVIRVRVREFTQLFNSLDPAPFLERDLDDDVVAYVTSWAREIPSDRPLRLEMVVDVPPREAADEDVLRAAVRNHFANAAELQQNAFRQLLRRGRRSLLIGLAVLGLAIVGSHLLGLVVAPPLLALAREGVLIGGWVAMWRPLEILLYDWWPVRNERLLYERLRDARTDLVSRDRLAT